MNYQAERLGRQTRSPTAPQTFGAFVDEGKKKRTGSGRGASCCSVHKHTFVEKRTTLDRAKEEGLRGDRRHARGLVPSLEESLEGHARTKLGLHLEPRHGRARSWTHGGNGDGDLRGALYHTRPDPRLYPSPPSPPTFSGGKQPPSPIMMGT
jgi:hypothetical protein